ncbi:hypothetical protein [Methylotenera versatilis]|uniref:Uncharacterized protein n=1 Tax=Methylotenera versatilis (strain 301) TaxID=666681 RepID=D7DNF0_METV0|nr:hypothetical protein [Methylotenera versatilis]ADI30951.1 hypothetical protein M301_2594 [Methylotenera versatilis 301]
MDKLLSKIEVAKRQLVTAIRLLFDGEDSVSVLSLAANAWEIIDVLCNREGVLSFSNQTRENIPAGKDLKYDYINSPYRNFFKHADRNPDAVLPSLKESNLEGLMFLAVEDYIRLLNKSPVEFQVFQIWYMAINTEKLAVEVLSDVVEKSKSIFPDITNLARADRLALGKQALLLAKSDQELMRDERTENTV